MGLFVTLTNQFDVEDQLGLGGNLPLGGCAVSELVGNEEATLAADAHAVEASVPARNDLVLAVGDADGLTTVEGGVELGAIGQVARVVDGVPLVRCGEFAGADFCVDVVEREAGGLKTEGLAEAGCFGGRDLLQVSGCGGG